jgi:3-hydroxybutyrate dehydrogenase
VNARVVTPLAGKHALVTGASRGIGAATAASLVHEGMKVTLLARDAGGLAQLARQLGPDNVTTVVADVGDAAAVRAAFTAARARFGPVQVLVNNAGQAASAKFTDSDETLWHRLMAVNLTGTYLCARAAITDMLASGFGRIVNISSTAGLRGAPYISVYASSKHAVIGLTRSLALEYATRNITVNAVCPGYVATDMATTAIATMRAKTGHSEEEALAALLATNPQGRLIEPQEVAATVLWLCQPGTESVSGQSIVLSGGGVS